MADSQLGCGGSGSGLPHPARQATTALHPLVVTAGSIGLMSYFAPVYCRYVTLLHPLRACAPAPPPAPQHLQQMKADMAAAQQRMVQEFAAQRAMAPGAAAAAAAAGGRAGGGAGGYDPAAELGLPPGLDFSQVVAAGGPEAFLQQMMQQANGGMPR